MTSYWCCASSHVMAFPLVSVIPKPDYYRRMCSRVPELSSGVGAGFHKRIRGKPVDSRRMFM